MNVGILLPGFSGSERDPAIPVQHDLQRALAEVEDVRLLALRYPHRRDRYRVFGVDVIALGVGQARGLRRLALWLDALRTLRRLHAERPFDVLHAMWADETGLVAAWAGRLLGVPVAVSLLGGELTRLDDIGYGLQRSAFSRWIVGQALGGADAVVVAGESARRAIRAAGYRVPDDRIRVAPPGIDASRFTPAAGIDAPPRLVHAASLIPVKDQPTLLRAVARLNATVTLDIAGDGPARPQLAALARDLGLGDRVRFRGSIPYDDMPGLYRGAAVHVMASRSEALGVVALEAAACGVPTIATAAGALVDYPALAHTVPVGDDAALAAAIRALLDDPGRRAEAGRAARALVEATFSVDQAVRRFRALYSDLVAGSRG